MRLAFEFTLIITGANDLRWCTGSNLTPVNGHHPFLPAFLYAEVEEYAAPENAGEERGERQCERFEELDVKSAIQTFDGEYGDVDDCSADKVEYTVSHEEPCEFRARKRGVWVPQFENGEEEYGTIEHDTGSE